MPDVQLALERLAKAYRAQFPIPVVGITGSVGKTTAKEMISAVLSRRFRILKTEGNLNNRIGIPMMLSRLGPEHEAAVIEMGISEFGEMSILADMVRPTAAVYTTIGHAHLEFLQDLDGVLRAKTEMLYFLPEDAPVVVNGDDEKLRNFPCRQRKILYGLGAHNAFRAENIVPDGEGISCELVADGEPVPARIPVRIPAFGQHHVAAALAAAAVGKLFGLSDEEIAAGIAAFHNVGRRGELVQTALVTMIDDSYNANPDSVRSGIDSLVQLPGGRHICILGDMLELGEESGRMHAEIGRYAREKGADLVLTAGSFAADTARGAGSAGRYYVNRDALIAVLPEVLREGDCVLVKASKGSHFEHVSAAIREMAQRAGQGSEPKMKPEPEPERKPEYEPKTGPMPEPGMANGKPFVLLDLDDTILDFKKAEARALSRSLTELNVPHDNSVLEHYNTLNLQYWERLENGELTREQVLVGRFVQLLAEMGSDADPKALRDRYEHNLSQGHFFVDGAEELLQTLAPVCRLFLVSNGTAVVQHGRLKSAGISGFFEKIFISQELGVNKPERAFFERCFAQIPDFDPARAIIVGDSLTSDIRGGRNAGIATCWFNLRQRQPRTDIVPDHRISALRELPPLLSRLYGFPLPEDSPLPREA